MKKSRLKKELEKALKINAEKVFELRELNKRNLEEKENAIQATIKNIQIALEQFGSVEIQEEISLGGCFEELQRTLIITLRR